MDNEPKSRADRDLAFLGTITTSMTHELANVILIIEQIGGLLEDLLETEREGRPVSCERLAVIQERLSRQTHRASNLIRGLNQFAHGIDQRLTEFDLNGLVRGLLEVSGRFANSRGVTVESQLAPGEIRVRADPFALQQAVFAALRRAFSICGPGKTVRITVTEDRRGPMISVQGPRGLESSTSAAQMDLLRPLLVGLGGSVSTKRKGTDEILIIRLEPLVVDEPSTDQD